MAITKKARARSPVNFPTQQVNRTGFAGGHFVKMRSHGCFVQHGVILILVFGWRYIADGLQKPPWLNQSIHSKVANSTASKLLHGPRR
ncbi:hypothetical protein At15955_53750 (plasmid) [Agrobacterium tumefaciens]|nr:hypothetical protein Ach5_51250 [Agrobacterium tumefaciens]AYM20360.1 hypothetical protein At15955_53750 [Agrobacterium tumefaciens]AYM71661.1 hypothetical protein AtA6_54450 [Agrobacterium tumefaciens]MQB27300.1 hypothetical protein [Agrobacterium tumefaciens]